MIIPVWILNQLPEPLEGSPQHIIRDCTVTHVGVIHSLQAWQSFERSTSTTGMIENQKPQQRK